MMWLLQGLILADIFSRRQKDWASQRVESGMNKYANEMTKCNAMMIHTVPCIDEKTLKREKEALLMLSSVAEQNKDKIEFKPEKTVK